MRAAGTISADIEDIRPEYDDGVPAIMLKCKDSDGHYATIMLIMPLRRHLYDCAEEDAIEAIQRLVGTLEDALDDQRSSLIGREASKRIEARTLLTGTEQDQKATGQPLPYSAS